MKDEKPKNVVTGKENKPSGNFRDSSNKTITSNTSDTTGDVPDFTTGNGDSSGGGGTSESTD